MRYITTGVNIHEVCITCCHWHFLKKAKDDCKNRSHILSPIPKRPPLQKTHSRVYLLLQPHPHIPLHPQPDIPLPLHLLHPRPHPPPRPYKCPEWNRVTNATAIIHSHKPMPWCVATIWQTNTCANDYNNNRPQSAEASTTQTTST